MCKQMVKMGVLTVALCVFFLDGTGAITDPEGASVDPEGIAVFSGLGSMALLIASLFWILYRRTAPLWFGFLCGLTVVCVVMYGGYYANLLSDEAFPHRPGVMEVTAALLAHPHWLGLIYCVVLTILAVFQKRGQRLKVTQA